MAQDYTELDLIISAGTTANVSTAFFPELKANLQDASAATSVSQSGSDSLGGIAGTAVAITAEADTNYIVLVTFSANPGGNLGEWWVINDSTTQFTIYNSGTATTSFKWAVIS